MEKISATAGVQKESRWAHAAFLCRGLAMLSEWVRSIQVPLSSNAFTSTPAEGYE